MTSVAPSASPSGLDDRDAVQTVRLLVSCEDQPGIVAAITTFLRDQGANIVQSDQYSTDPEGGRFYMRVVFHLPGADLPALRERFAAEVAEPFAMRVELHDAARAKRVAIMVSRYDHCLLDLLWRSRRGELPMDVGVVVSNWPDMRAEVERFGLPYHEIPVTKDTKPAAEAAQLEVLGGGQYDLVIMARYMQILSDDFLRAGGLPGDQHPPLLPAGLRRRGPV